MNLQARLYDPTIGRFLSVDPLFEMQIGINPYHYCGNDPVNYSDPSGLSGTGVYFRSDDYTSEGKRIWYEIPRSETVTVIGGQKSASEINSLNAYNMNQSGNECYNGVKDMMKI